VTTGNGELFIVSAFHYILSNTYSGDESGVMDISSVGTVKINNGKENVTGVQFVVLYLVKSL